MKHIIILIAWFSVIYQAKQDFFVCKNAQISLYSKAPVEDIEAHSESGTSIYNPASGDLDFSIAIKSFRFDKSRMQEHFNDEYMESDKFPRATFKGKILDHVDVTRDGAYAVTVKGVLDIHGVKQTRTIPGKINIKNGMINMTSEFIVACADHRVEIPKIVFYNIGETIKINVSASYNNYKK